MMRINNLTYVKALWALWKLLYESNINTNDPYWQSASFSTELHWCLCSKNIISKHKTFILESFKKPIHRITSNGFFFVIVVVQSLSGVRLFGTPWTAAHQASLSFTTSQSLLRLMFIELVMPSNSLILCHLLLLLPSLFPCIRVFLNESAVHIRWPKYLSFSISPFNE